MHAEMDAQDRAYAAALAARAQVVQAVADHLAATGVEAEVEDQGAGALLIVAAADDCVYALGPSEDLTREWWWDRHVDGVTDLGAQWLCRAGSNQPLLGATATPHDLAVAITALRSDHNATPHEPAVLRLIVNLLAGLDAFPGTGEFRDATGILHWTVDVRPSLVAGPTYRFLPEFAAGGWCGYRLPQLHWPTEGWERLTEAATFAPLDTHPYDVATEIAKLVNQAERDH